MIVKTKTITLTGPHHNHPDDYSILRWRVERVTDSIEYHPGDLLEKKAVGDLCAASDWKVTITAIS